MIKISIILQARKGGAAGRDPASYRTELAAPSAGEGYASAEQVGHTLSFALLQRCLECNDMSENDRTIFRRDDGNWANKRDGARRPASLHTTQQQAVDAAKQNLLNSGGGELKTKGLDGRIRSKDTIGRADPLPPRDREH